MASISDEQLFNGSMNAVVAFLTNLLASPFISISKSAQIENGVTHLHLFNKGV